MKFRKYSHRSATVEVKDDELLGRRGSMRQIIEEKKDQNEDPRSCGEVGELETPEITQHAKAQLARVDHDFLEIDHY